MATKIDNAAASTTPAAKTAKVKRAPVALSTRIQDQLSRAVLQKKITKAEIEALAVHMTKLTAFLE